MKYAFSLNLLLLASCQNFFLITDSHTRVCDQRRIRFAMLELVFTGTAGSSWSELFLTIPTVRAAPSPFLPCAPFFLSYPLVHHLVPFFVYNEQKSEHCVRSNQKNEGSFFEHLSVFLFFFSFLSSNFFINYFFILAILKMAI